ncbi:MAG: T9SS type A sorting domain-containing protein [Candidatus Kapaibacterium sp.]
MFKHVKRSIFFAFILTAAIISFNGSFNTESIYNSTVPNPNLLDTITILANPGPSNNGGSPNWAAFFDLIAGSRDISVTQMSTGSTAAASASYSVEVFIRSGTALGGPVGSGSGSSSDGWTSLGIVPVTQGPVGSGISLVFTLPTISVPAFDTVGVAIKFIGVGPRYFGTGSPPYSTYADTNLALVTGDGRSIPFTPTGSWFGSRALTGEIRYVINPVSVIGNIGNEIPKDFKLSQNYPNPFNPVTKIQYSMPENSYTTLMVYDYLGREIQTLFSGNRAAGTYEVTFNGSALSSGVYYYKLTTDKFTETKKMILSK